MKYFSNLNAGWADLKIGKFKGKCSYIQNVPFIVLMAWEEFQDLGYCIIQLDGEDAEYEIIITEHGVKIFTYDYSGSHFCTLKEFETHQQKYHLLKDLVMDIVDNVDEWSDWLCMCDKNTIHYNDVFNKYKLDISNKIKKLGLEKGEN